MPLRMSTDRKIPKHVNIRCGIRSITHYVVYGRYNDHGSVYAYSVRRRGVHVDVRFVLSYNI